MSLFEFPPAMRPRIRIDTDFLVRQVATLARVKWKRRTWNECGEKVFRDFVRSSRTVHLRASRVDAATASEASAYWIMAKGLVHAVVASRDPRHEAIRKRLGNLLEPSTPRLWSTLSLWLAGVLGISTSVTGPLVAVMLYGVAEAGGNWEALRDSRSH
jgi:hypothetical protein